jgi:DNA-binding transcriptional ArsR family regulator
LEQAIMSINAISDVMRCGPVFKHAEKAVLLAMANCVNDEGYCWPSVNEIAWNTGMAVRSVQRAIPDLEDLSLVELVEQGGGRRANRYRLNVEWLAAAAASIYRKKKQAVQDGVNRYDEMAELAEAVRACLEKEMHEDPIRGLRWRQRHRKATSRDDTVSSLRGDTESGVNVDKKICGVADVTPGVTLCRPGVTLSHPSPDTVSPEPIIESSESFIEASVAETDACEFSTASSETDPPADCSTWNNCDDPPRRDTSNRSRLSGKGYEVAPKTLPPVSKFQVEHKSAKYRIEKTRDAFNTTQKLATALGMQQHQICMALGSLTLAEDMAKRWAAGELMLGDVKAQLNIEGKSEELGPQREAAAPG